MDQQSTSNLPPLPPEDNVEKQYAEVSEEEDQTETIQSLINKMQDLSLTQGKKKAKRRQSTSFTPGTSPSEPKLPRHVRPEESASSQIPGPRATSTPTTEQRPQYHQRRAFFSTHTNPSTSQNQKFRQERPVVRIKSKDYSLNFNGEEVERIAQIEGAREEYLAMKMAFQKTNSKISGA
ncbi:hypothetical protein O181_043426 [Austropuccinia psidii MF-1]|uniref:Uncharacterized protein n=1 Tax=Austropuccinia psidii MF-1 TaxID=1389203 RepID=A0A9Q3HFZ1_9BASI|nr:hypothetical protein [Austropuccinia psidii MF-1]